METIQTFVLGAFCALALVGLGYSFISALRISKTVKQLTNDISGLNRYIEETRSSVDERINYLENNVDHRMDDICNEAKNTHKEIRQIIDDVQLRLSNQIGALPTMSYTDSRFDKTIDNLCSRMDIQYRELIKVTTDHSRRISELEPVNKIEQINS